MKLKHLLFLTPVFLVACGEPQPSKDDLSSKFNKEHEALELVSIDLKKSEQHGDLVFYSAEGKFKVKEDLYSRLSSNFSDTPNFYKLIGKAGESYDFTTTVVAQGNDKAGWKVDIQQLNSKLPKYNFIQSELDTNSHNVLIVNSDDFQQKMDKLKTFSEEQALKLEANNKKIADLEIELESVNRKENDYWSTLEIDGIKFKSKWNVMQYIDKEVDEYKSENKIYKFQSKYDNEIYSPKKKAIYQSTQSYDEKYYAEINAERDRVFKEYEEKFNAGLAPLEAAAAAKLKKYTDEYDALGKTRLQIINQKSDLNKLGFDLERDAKMYEKIKADAIKEGYIKS